MLLRALTVFALACPAFAQQLHLDDLHLDDLVERARKEFNVPGISVGVVKDGKVVFAKGYGIRTLGQPSPMSAGTLVGIASNTKAFSSGALAMLVDEGKLNWDDRVIDKVPGFQMSDAYVSREMRIRDLPCHRSGLGLGAGDLMFWPESNLTAADVLYRLRFVPIASSFRSTYAYDNILYNVIGEVIRNVSGKPWSDFIRGRFFVPLGMKSSLTSIAQVKPDSDVVSPHALDDGVLKPLRHNPLDNTAPAGAIVSSVDDLTKWVMTLLNKGVTPDGKRLISEAQMKALWTPLIFVSNSEPPPSLAEARSNFRAYAMGEAIGEYRGHLQVAHTGGLAGMVTEVSMIPDMKLGVIVLTNQEQGGAFQAITNSILDHFMNAPAKDWVTAYADLRRKQEVDAAKAMADSAARHQSDSKPNLPLAAYAGRYRDPWYGDVLVTESAGKLTMQFSHNQKLTGELEHWQYDTFIARWKDRSLLADAYVNFTLNSEGKVDSIAMKAVSPLTEFSFDFHDLRLKPVPMDAAPWD